MKTLFLIVSLTMILCISALNVFGQTGTITGKAINKETKEIIPFVNIIMVKNGNQFGGTTSNTDGKYTISKLPKGVYDLKATFLGFDNVLEKGVKITNDSIVIMDIFMKFRKESLEIDVKPIIPVR